MVLWSERDKHTLRSLYDLGTPIRRIAHTFHRSKHAILNKARRLGLVWGGVKLVPVPRVENHEDPLISAAVTRAPEPPKLLTFEEERELKRPSHNIAKHRVRPTRTLPEPPVSVDRGIDSPLFADTPKIVPIDECGCPVATGSGIENGEGYTLCLKCRLPRKRI